MTQDKNALRAEADRRWKLVMEARAALSKAGHDLEARQAEWRDAEKAALAVELASKEHGA